MSNATIPKRYKVSIPTDSEGNCFSDSIERPMWSHLVFSGKDGQLYITYSSWELTTEDLTYLRLKYACKIEEAAQW